MNLVLGAGLAGLSAGYTLREGVILEKADNVGGLAKTLSFGPCRFDIGGHRFFTDLPEVQKIVEDLLGPELLIVPRHSCILFQGQRIPYPLRPVPSIKAMGLKKALFAIGDYLYQRAKSSLKKEDLENLESWVISHFGRRLYRAYFKDYSEKVWGIPAPQISSHWISKRIQNLNLKDLILSIFFPSDKRTLIDSFLYPKTGIGRIAEALKESIEKNRSVVFTSSRIEKINHDGRRIYSVRFLHEGSLYEVPVNYIISTIPLPTLLRYLDGPSLSLNYRSLLLVVPVFERDRITNETWIYIPQREVLFGRVHEPKNWSPQMAPEGFTHLVVEYFCNKGDKVWNQPDSILINQTLRYLKDLSIIEDIEPLDATVVRIPYAYPTFEVNYRKNLEKALRYLSRFKNLILAGRTGAFSYLNMDEAMASGLRAARMVMEDRGGIKVRPRHITMAA